MGLTARRKLAAALLMVVVLFLWWNMVRRALAGPGSQYEDFVAFARDLLIEGENLYETYPSWDTIVKYPPFFAFVYAPLVSLPAWLGASIWFWTSLVCSLGAAVASALAVGATPRELRRRPSLVWMPYLLIGSVVISNLETAQVNLFLLFFWTVALLLVARGRQGFGGALLGYTAAVKLTSGIFVLYFAWIRRWRAALAAALAVAVCWSVVLLLGLGSTALYLDVMRGWLTEVSRFVIQGAAAEGDFRHTNQSLAAAVHRFLTATPADGEELYVNAAALDPSTAQAMVLAISVALVLFLVWVTRDLGRTPSTLQGGLGMGLVMIATLFLSPVSWINHYVLLLFPYAAAWRYVATRPAEDPIRRLLIGCLVASFVLVGAGVSRLLLAFSLPLAGAGILFAGVARAVREAAD